MTAKYQSYIHSLTFVLVLAISIWALLIGTVQTKELLTYLILVVAALEALALYTGRNIHSESHTSIKFGVLATLIILLGIKNMVPQLFPSLTITVLAINFVYNFYISQKRIPRKSLRQKRKLKL